MSQNDKQHDLDDSGDEPLSPEAQAVMDRAGRRAAISMILMLIGFMAIVIVVVYRLATMTPELAERYSVEAVALPVGAVLIGADLAEGMITVSYTLPEGGGGIRVFDGADGTLLREIAINAEP